MRALVFDGEEKTIRFVTDHTDPPVTAGQVLIKVSLAGICSTDLQLIAGYMDFSGIPGHEFVGMVVAGPSKWLDKRVVGEINCVCGRCDMCAGGLRNHCRKRTVIGIDGRDGAFAELLAVPEQNLQLVPDELTDQEAVFTEPLAAALEITSQIAIDSRMKLTVIGPGKLGLLVAQVLAMKGGDLHVVGRSVAGLKFAEKCGIRSFHIKELTASNDRDVVIDCTGNSQGLALAMKLVRPRGTIVLKSTYAGSDGVNLTPVVVNELNIVGSRCGPFAEAISVLVQKKIDVLGMISREFDLSDGVKALQYAAQDGVLKVLLKMS